mgnify:CR=1 FL=1
MSEYLRGGTQDGPLAPLLNRDPRVELLDKRLTALNERLDAVESRLDEMDKKLTEDPPKPKKRSGRSPEGICVVTGQPSGETCEHVSTYRYQQGCQGACVEQGRAYYRQYYYDRNHKS